MDLATLEATLTPLLADLGSKESLQALQNALINPETIDLDRPWQANRYSAQEIPGIEALWEIVARQLMPLLTREDPAIRTLGTRRLNMECLDAEK